LETAILIIGGKSDMMIPDQLSKHIANGTIGWGRAERLAFDQLLKRYALENSIWLGLQIDASRDGEATAVILLDAVRNKLKVPALAPILLVRFPAVASVSLWNYEKSKGSRRRVARVQTRSVSNGLSKTVISDRCGGHMFILHKEPVRVLCFTAQGEKTRLNAKP
jgi:hypothetical protein